MKFPALLKKKKKDDIEEYNRQLVSEYPSTIFLRHVKNKIKIKLFTFTFGGIGRPEDNYATSDELVEKSFNEFLSQNEREYISSHLVEIKDMGIFILVYRTSEE